MSAGAFMFGPSLIVAYLLYLALRRFVVNSRFSHLVLFAVLLAATFLTLPFAWSLVAAGRLRHERQTQRDTVSSRISQAGGWEALKRDSISLIEQHKDSYFDWNRHDTNALPVAIAALKPMSVEYYPPKFLSELKDGRFTDPPNVHIVRIQIFGMHSTGGRSTPFFGLEVVTGAESGSYRPRPGGGVSGNSHTTYTRVGEDIYEIY
jgi:hypothetical protein